MRKLLVAVAIVVVLALASPFAIGLVAEDNLRSRIENTSSNQLVSLRVTDYDRGWLRSTARIELGIAESYRTQIETLAQQPQLSELLSSFSIPVIVELAHGPVLLGEPSGIAFLGVRAFPDPQSQPIQQIQLFLGTPYLFELRGKSGFGSGFAFTGEIPPFDGAFGDLSYEFAGLDVSGVSRPDHLEFEAAVDDASVQHPFMSAVLESLAVKGDTALRPGRLSLGTTEASLGRLTAINPMLGAEPAVSVENLSIATITSENAEATHLDMEVIYRIGRIAAAGVFELDDAALGLRLGHIDSEAVDGLIEAASAMQLNANQTTVVETVLPLLDRIVAGSPELTIDPLQFSLPEGAFAGRLHVGIDGGDLPTGSIMDFMNPTVALGALSADASVTASKPLVAAIARLAVGQNMPPMTGPDGEPLPPEQTAAMLDAQVAQTMTMLTTFGIVTASGNDYSCTVRLADGALTANGQPVPLPF